VNTDEGFSICSKQIVAALVFASSVILRLTAVAHAAEVSISVRDVPNDRGHVLVALCLPKEFLEPRCSYQGSAPARSGVVIVRVSAVTPGRYAIQAFHDENDNLFVDRDFLGLPTELIGFGNDAPVRFGPPRFEDAAVEVPAQGLQTTLRLRSIGAVTGLRGD
jgi:uncharacterized protein (DUF2141 family)